MVKIERGGGSNHPLPPLARYVSRNGLTMGRLNKSLASGLLQPSFSIQRTCFPQIKIYQICLKGSGGA